MTTTPQFDRLAAVLFDGPVKVDHIHVEHGTDPTVTSEAASAALYASMERVGLIADGALRVPEPPAQP
jgi:hypothetical protein